MPTQLRPLLPFAAGSRVPEGFGHLGDDGELRAEKRVETWISARTTHVFGLGALLGEPGAEGSAAHGVAALREGTPGAGRPAVFRTRPWAAGTTS